MYETVIKIDGMMCGMCEAHMNDAIRRVVPDAKKVKSSHKKGETTFRSESPVDDEILKNVVTDTGYTFISSQTFEK
ncbi:MAG: heavy-metal-associated domain-containing protein [Eubacterium sp.]|nr:heavy-metal-associated domain-containing protein [Eubacterium sp.]